MGFRAVYKYHFAQAIVRDDRNRIQARRTGTCNDESVRRLRHRFSRSRFRDVNGFQGDSQEEWQYVRQRALEAGAVGAQVSTHWSDGGKGAEALVEAVIAGCQRPSNFRLLYPDSMPIKQKIETVATRMYGADGVTFEPAAEEQIETASRLGFDEWPVCMAKTPLSLSHDPALKGRPTGFMVPVKELRILAGAGFLTAICSGIQLMPGLPTLTITSTAMRKRGASG